jgi:hypothetical protein
MNLSTGLNYILGHFQFQEPIFPRSISTKTTEGRQFMVFSRQEALARFAQANSKDCRISAYPPNAAVNPSGLERFQGLRNTIPRNLIVMIDLDKLTFKSERALRLALSRTLQKIKSVLDVEPTVMWSGNGYHIYLVLSSHVNLENVKQFSDLKINHVSLKFLRFAEMFLSCGKSDKAHNATVSFNNCMMRIPGSINSKNNSEVKIIQQWDGVNRPAINYLLADFCGYIANEEARKLQELQKQSGLQKRGRRYGNKKMYLSNTHIHIYTHIQWIEKLLQSPIANGRKYCIWRVLVPYLINRKHLSEEQCTEIIKTWLNNCSKLERLNFNINQKINDAIKRVGEYGPVHHDKLKKEYPELYSLIVTK